MYEVKNKFFSRGGLLLANFVPMLEQKSNEKGYFSKAGQLQRCYGLGKENTFCRKGSVFQVVMQNHPLLHGSQNSKAVKRDNFPKHTACKKGYFHRNSEHTV